MNRIADQRVLFRFGKIEQIRRLVTSVFAGRRPKSISAIPPSQNISPLIVYFPSSPLRTGKSSHPDRISPLWLFISHPARIPLIAYFPSSPEYLSFDCLFPTQPEYLPFDCLFPILTIKDRGMLRNVPKLNLDVKLSQKALLWWWWGGETKIAGKK